MSHTCTGKKIKQNFIAKHNGLKPVIYQTKNNKADTTIGSRKC